MTCRRLAFIPLIAGLALVAAPTAAATQYTGKLEIRHTDDFKRDRSTKRHMLGPLTERQLWIVFCVTFGLAMSIGLLEVDSTEPDAFDESDVPLIETLARALSGPVELSSLYGRLQARERQHRNEWQ